MSIVGHMRVLIRRLFLLPLLLGACTPGVDIDVRRAADEPPADPSDLAAAAAPMPIAAPALAIDLDGPFEPAPRLPSTELLPGLPLIGPGYRIGDQAQVVDYFGQFELRSDVGTVTADGAELLRLRVRELDAVRALERLSRTEVFKDANRVAELCWCAGSIAARSTIDVEK